MTGCDTSRDPAELVAPGSGGQLVLDAYLLVNLPIPPVFVRQTLPPNVPFTLEAAAIRGATVLLDDGTSTFTYAEDPDLPGRYLPERPDPESPPPLIERLTRYEIRVESDGRTMRAWTFTPDQLDIEEAAIVHDETLEDLRQLRIYDEATPDPCAARENAVVYQEGLLEARFAPLDVPSYQVAMFPLDPNAEAVIDLQFLDLDDEEIQEFFAEARAGSQSPPLEVEDGNLRLPWFAIVFGGPHKMRLFALDENWFDYVRSNGQTNPGYAGGLAGDNFERPIFHVEGGIGLLGSASVDSICFNVQPPD